MNEQPVSDLSIADSGTKAKGVSAVVADKCGTATVGHPWGVASGTNEILQLQLRDCGSEFQSPQLGTIVIAMSGHRTSNCGYPTSSRSHRFNRELPDGEWFDGVPVGW